MNEGDAGVLHAVEQRQTDDAGRGSHVAHLAPKEVARLVAAHLAVGRSAALVFLHLKLIVVDALGVGEGIVAVNVDVRVLVFPVDVVGGFPLVVGFVERVAHVVATVAAGFQSAGRAAVVVDDVDAHHVSVAEAVVTDTCQRQLLDAAR